MGIRIAVFAVVLIWSGLAPSDRLTWWLEVLPGLLAAAVLVATYRYFRFTGLVYSLILLLCIILFVGGHYTYAEVPLFNWIRDHIGGTRNNFDKLGHFAQGFVPAAVVREVLIRAHVLARKSWTGPITVAFCLAISAAYELFEWFVSLCTGSAGDAFLGTQGYVWDTQSDMLLALIGATCCVVFLGPLHDRRIAALQHLSGTSAIGRSGGPN